MATKIAIQYDVLRERVLTCIETFFAVAVDAIGDPALSRHRDAIQEAVEKNVHWTGAKSSLEFVSGKLGAPVRSEQERLRQMRESASAARRQTEPDAWVRRRLAEEAFLQQQRGAKLDYAYLKSEIAALLRQTTLDDEIKLDIAGAGPISVILNFCEIPQLYTAFHLQTAEPLVEHGIKAAAKLAARALNEIQKAAEENKQAGTYAVDAETTERLRALYERGMMALLPGEAVVEKSLVQRSAQGQRDFNAIDIGVRKLVPFYLKTYNIPTLHTYADLFTDLPAIDRNTALQPLHTMLSDMALELSQYTVERYPAYAPVALINAGLQLQALSPNAPARSLETPRHTIQNALEILVQHSTRRLGTLLMSHGARTASLDILNKGIRVPLVRSGYTIPVQVLTTVPKAESAPKPGLAGIYTSVNVTLRELITLYLYAVRDMLTVDTMSSARDDVLDFRTSLLNLPPIVDHTGLVPAHSLLTQIESDLKSADEKLFTTEFRRLKQLVTASLRACEHAWCASKSIRPAVVDDRPTVDMPMRRKTSTIRNVKCSTTSDHVRDTFDTLNQIVSVVTDAVNKLPETMAERAVLKNNLRATLHMLQNAGVEISTQLRANRRARRVHA